MRKRPAPPDLGDGLLSLREAAKLLGLAEITLRTWSLKGKIGFIKLGRRKLFSREELARFAAQHTVKAAK